MLIFTSEVHKNYTIWTCQKVCEALTFQLVNIYIRFGTKLFRQIVGISMGTNSAPLVANLFLFCYERDFLMSLSVDNQLKSLKLLARLRYLDDLLNIELSQMVQNLLDQGHFFLKECHRARSSSQVKHFCMGGKPLSQETDMTNMKALSETIQKL